MNNANQRRAQRRHNRKPQTFRLVVDLREVTTGQMYLGDLPQLPPGQVWVLLHLRHYLTTLEAELVSVPAGASAAG